MAGGHFIQEATPLPSIESLRSLFQYDPISGVVSSHIDALQASITAAVARGKRGRIRVNGVRYPLARIAWKLGYGADPPGQVRFYDRNPRNFKLINLVSDENLKSYDDLYTVWIAMIRRCTIQSDSNYRNYGGRGIDVCDRWKRSFDLFKADMGPRPTGCSVHRVDNNGNYEPSNCKWATTAEQNAPGARRFVKPIPPRAARCIRVMPKSKPYLLYITLKPGSKFHKYFATFQEAIEMRDLIEYEREVYRYLSHPSCTPYVRNHSHS